MRAFEAYLSELSPAAIETCKVQRRQVVSPAKPVTLLTEPPGRLRYLEAEDMERLLSQGEDPPVSSRRPIVVTALHAGMRFGEIRGLKWDDVDLRHRLSTMIWDGVG